jgi:hypothetical protein
MSKKVDVDDLVSAAEIAARFGFNDRNLAHSWMKRYPEFPRPVVRLAIGNVWIWSEVEGWAASTGHGRWDELPPEMPTDGLVPLRAWAAKYDVPPGGLTELAAEGLLPLAKKGGRFYLDPDMAEAVWAEHEERMVAKYRVLPGARRTSRRRS